MDIQAEIIETVPYEFYQARYSKEYARREMAVQKRAVAHHAKVMKEYRKHLIKTNLKPF